MPAKSAWSSLRRPSGPLSPVMLLLAALFNIVALFYQLNIISSRAPTYTYIGDDRPRELPIKLRTVNMAFRDDPDHHYALAGAQADVEWRKIAPPGGGFAYLGDAEYSFSVSMWHQVHCLDQIRRAIVYGLGEDEEDHIEHCFHYVRQGIMCAADTTLEAGGTGMVLVNGDKVAPGQNETHTCKDWRQVYDWLAEEEKKWTPEMKGRQSTVNI